MMSSRVRLLSAVVGRQCRLLVSEKNYSSTTSLEVTDPSELIVEKLDGPLEGTCYNKTTHVDFLGLL